MQVIGCQLNIAWEDKAANFARVRELLAAQKPEAGALVALPEMFATGFSMRPERIADGPDRATETFLAEIAREYVITLVGGLVTLGADGRGRNEAVVFGPDGKLLCRYVKMHPFSYGGEAKHYGAGDRPLLFKWQGLIVAPFVCYDLRFPEIFRSAVRQGAEMFVVIANWPEAREMHWRALLLARAIENQAYVLGVNRCGEDPELRYVGRSRVLDPRGELLSDAGNTEGLVSAEVAPEALYTYRDKFPALADIHPEYVPIL